MKNIKILFYVLSMGFLLVSCGEVETFKIDIPYVYSFQTDKSTIYDNLSDTCVVVQYNGPVRSTETAISYAIDPSGTDAVAGTDYDLILPSVVIPANEPLGRINFNLYKMASGASKKITFNITEDPTIYEPWPTMFTKHVLTIKGPTVEFTKTSASTYDTVSTTAMNAGIKLLGNREIAQTIGYVVDATSTAVAGVHYNLVTGASPITLPANTASTKIDYELIPGCMATTPTDKKLVLTLNSTGNLKPTSSSLGKYTLTLVSPKAQFVYPEFKLRDGYGLIDIPIKLVNRLANVDRTVSFSVDAASYAVAGVHYNIITPSPITLAANQKNAKITIEILDGLEKIHKDHPLIINLTNSGTVGAGTAKTCKIIIEAPL